MPFTEQNPQAPVTAPAPLGELAAHAALTSDQGPVSLNPTEYDVLEPQDQLEALCAWVEETRAQYPTEESGHSSFYDVTGNILTIAGPCMRYWLEDGEPEDLAEALQSMELLREYHDIVTSDEAILHAEMTERDGAFPRLRQQADDEAARGEIRRPIARYIELMWGELAPKQDQ